jgi:hypothetical protein
MHHVHRGGPGDRDDPRTGLTRPDRPPAPRAV